MHRLSIALVTKYTLSGSVGALTQLVVFYLLTISLGEELYLRSTSIAFIAGLSVGFLLQKLWTFRDLEVYRTPRQFVMFFVIGGVNLFINGLLMYFFIEEIGIWYINAQLVTAIVLSFESFIMNRYFTFYDADSHHDRTLSS